LRHPVLGRDLDAYLHLGAVRRAGDHPYRNVDQIAQAVGHGRNQIAAPPEKPAAPAAGDQDGREVPGPARFSHQADHRVGREAGRGRNAAGQADPAEELIQ